jgi:predicted metalloprotease with PDZ domain
MTACGSLIAFAGVIAVALNANAQSGTTSSMTLAVDATQVGRRIIYVHEEIRLPPGIASLSYPRWIPGEHGPTGPIQQLAALQIRSGSATLQWERDPEDIYTIHVKVPSGTVKINVDFDALLENTISDRQCLLAWNTVLLYPRSANKRNLMIQPSILLPPNWQQGSSLQVASQTGTRISFVATSLERLIDSPVLAGEFFRAVPLASSWPAELDITADSQAALDRSDDAHAFTLFGKLVEEDRAMFGSRHWETLHFLVSQSDARSFDGLEHEDSPYTAIGDAALSKPDQLKLLGWSVLAHEQAHSWDGKYRRPAELYSKVDYQGPERTSLLWVYEGLTEYIGMVLATRTGFNDAAYMRDYLAQAAAYYSHEAGRAYAALVDTATANWVLRNVDDAWSSLRRGQDYYDGGALIWLEADAIIRRRSNGRLSLDDFLRSFFGGRVNTGPIVAAFSRGDLESSLSSILPYDWHTFFETRVYQPDSEPPTGGIEAAGWKLVYDATPNNQAPFEEGKSGPSEVLCHAAYSIGIDVLKDGLIDDVVPGTPAYDAGLGPHMTIIAVAGKAYSPDTLNEAIAHPLNGKIAVLVRNFDSVESHEIRYAGGLRFPHLERIKDGHDFLTEILLSRSDVRTRQP